MLLLYPGNSVSFSHDMDVQTNQQIEHSQTNILYDGKVHKQFNFYDHNLPRVYV